MLAALALLNLLAQVARKPAELLFPVSGVLDKTPEQTWRAYGPLFRRYSTRSISAELLAALAQAEGAGNPAARTPWRLRATTEPLELWRPASSAVGMYQITDGTYREARRHCIRSHAVVDEGAWYDWRACWFNALYLRVLPSHSIEMTSAYLDREVARVATRLGGGLPAGRREQLAAAIHLCGAAGAEAFAAAGFRARGRKCAGQDLERYLARVESLRREFARMAQA